MIKIIDTIQQLIRETFDLTQYRQWVNRSLETWEGQKTRKLLQKLEYVMQVQSLNFQRIKIYRYVQPPYDYYMQYTHQHLNGDPLYQERVKHYRKIPNSKNVVQLEGINLSEDKQMCVELKVLQVYCRYYNYTLTDILNKKRKTHKHHLANNLRSINETARHSCKSTSNNSVKIGLQSILTANNSNSQNYDYSSYANTSSFGSSIKNCFPVQIVRSGFNQPDMWYVLTCLLSVGEAYQTAYKEEFGGFKADKVYLSPDGYIKVYLLEEFQQLPINFVGCKTQQEKLQRQDFSAELHSNIEYSVDNNINRKALAYYPRNLGIRQKSVKGSVPNRSSIYYFEKPSEVQIEIHQRKPMSSIKPQSKPVQNIKMAPYFSSGKLQSWNKSNYRHPEKSDIFDIGVIILQMITLDTQSDYHDMHSRPKLQFIHYTINNLDRRGISIELQTLLKGMLQTRQKRINYQQVNKIIKKYRSQQPRNQESRISYCIKFEDDEEYESKQNIDFTIDYDNKKNQFKKIPIQKYLVPSKLEIVSQKYVRKLGQNKSYNK